MDARIVILSNSAYPNMRHIKYSLHQFCEDENTIFVKKAAAFCLFLRQNAAGQRYCAAFSTLMVTFSPFTFHSFTVPKVSPAVMESASTFPAIAS